MITLTTGESFQALKERHLLTQLTHRLWEEVAALDLEPDRVIHLLYSGEDVDDDAALCAEDVRHALQLATERVQQGGGWHQSGLLGHVQDLIHHRQR